MKTKVFSLLIVLFVFGLGGPAPECFNQGTAFAQSGDEALRLYQEGGDRLDLEWFSMGYMKELIEKAKDSDIIISIAKRR
jgi:hypothetical protein